MKRFVLDASVTLAWCFEDQQTSYSEAALKRVGEGAVPVVPALWIYEVANVLALANREGVIDRAKAAAFWREVRKVVSVDEKTDGDTGLRIMDLAESRGLTAYDAAYLELALREKLPLATLDKKLKKAANAAGAALFA